MNHVKFRPSGICAVQIEFDLDDSKKLHNVVFTGGCNGNLQGLCRLVKGMKVEDVISKLEGIRCGSKTTSCPDQLCRALREMKA